MAKVLVSDQYLTQIATAIRTLKGVTDTYTPAQMAPAINAITKKVAATITPGTSDQTIAAGTYLTGAQTIAGDADLIASNIISTANIFGV